MLRVLRKANVPAALVLALIGAIMAGGCSSRSKVIGVEDDDGPPLDLGIVTEAGAPETSAGMCPSNTCPAGLITCPGTSLPCAVDLMSDDDNCGACGVRCRQDPAFLDQNHGIARCVEGTCRMVCQTTHADCNGLPDDGCEVDLVGHHADKNNCGGCGIVCKDQCYFGVCDCKGGAVCDDGQCYNTDWDNANCGGCGINCVDDQPPYRSELNMTRTCKSGVCNQPTCSPGWTDCNGDFPDEKGDGCETFFVGDAANCGVCGHACKAGEQCIEGECRCSCGSECFTKIDSDVENCGTCGFVCPGDFGGIRRYWELAVDPAHGKPVCEQGTCGYTCSPNFADCDSDIANGCETDILGDPMNCGGCGIRCDAIEGQPCVDGKCLTKECDIK